jgi:hypothetical protein
MLIMMARLLSFLSVCLLVSTAAAFPSFSLPTLKLFGRSSSSTSSAEISTRQLTDVWRPAIDADFPDPCIAMERGGKFYAFATSGNGRRVQVASAPNPLGPWTRHANIETLPKLTWTTKWDFWAPDVKQLDDGTWIMYFSGIKPDTGGKHCVGVAKATKPLGPYTMDAQPLICPLELGGAIDPHLFIYQGKHYVAYKVDGYASGKSNPTIALNVQQVETDGSAVIGKPVVMLSKPSPDEGNNIEAPFLKELPNGNIALFYSSHIYNTDAYDVRVAVAEKLAGPWQRIEPAVMVTDAKLRLHAPGGWQALDGEIPVGVFHGKCRDRTRCMYVTPYQIVGQN